MRRYQDVLREMLQDQPQYAPRQQYTTRLDQQTRKQLIREGRCFACRQLGHGSWDSRCSMNASSSTARLAQNPSPVNTTVRQPVSLAVSQNTTPPKASVWKVFTTVELLENVLKFLPAKQLLEIGRICKGVSHIVNDSPRIQKILYQRPDQSTIPTTWIWNGSKILSGQDAKDFIRTKPNTLQEERNVHTLNPLLLVLPVKGKPQVIPSFQTKSPRRVFATRLSSAVRNGQNTTSCAVNTMYEGRLQKLSADATCLSMQLANPPVLKVDVKYCAESSIHVDLVDGVPRRDTRMMESHTIEKENGVLFGDVVEAVVKGGQEGNSGRRRLVRNVLSHLEFPGGFPVTEEEMQEYEEDVEKERKIRQFKEAVAAAARGQA